MEETTFRTLLKRASISARELEMYSKYPWWKFLSEEEKEIIRSVEWEGLPQKPQRSIWEILDHLARVVL